MAFDVAVTTASDRATQLYALVDGHLGFEDTQILPLITQHLDAADYDEVEAKALAAPKLGEPRFTVPRTTANANSHSSDGCSTTRRSR